MLMLRHINIWRRLYQKAISSAIKQNSRNFWPLPAAFLDLTLVSLSCCFCCCSYRPYQSIVKSLVAPKMLIAPIINFTMGVSSSPYPSSVPNIFPTHPCCGHLILNASATRADFITYLGISFFTFYVAYEIRNFLLPWSTGTTTTTTAASS